MHGTSYKVERGEYGDAKYPYRLNVDHDGVLVAFNEVRFYAGLIGLSKDGADCATLRQNRVNDPALSDLKEIAEE